MLQNVEYHGAKTRPNGPQECIVSRTETYWKLTIYERVNCNQSYAHIGYNSI